MRPKHLVTLLVLPAVLLAILLTLAVPVSPAHAGGVVAVCDEAHLRAALTGSGAVTFSCSGTITLTAEIVIAADTTIDGSGQTVTLSGNHAVRVFTVNAGMTLNLNELTVADGSSNYGGGGIRNNGGTLTVSNSTFRSNTIDYRGGGIYNASGTVTVNNSTFAGNYTRPGDGGGIYSDGGTVTVSNSTFSDNSADGRFSRGGGIYSRGILTVSNSTFASNSTIWDGDGGGIYSEDALTVGNCTFSGNHADDGGGIYSASGAVTVSNSTFLFNSAYEGNGGGIANSGTLIVSNSTFSGNNAITGGGIFSYGTVTLKNTIVANNPTGGNCAGAITDGGGNLSYPDATCPGINGDPRLGPLQDNGGPTQTMALLPGSAAIDAGNDAICAAPPVNNRDQRGFARPQGAHCDIGAYETTPLLRVFLPVIMR